MPDPAKEPAQFRPTDSASKANLAEYEAMIESINQAMNPESNTVLIVDDEVGIRRFVRRSILKSDPSLVIFEAGNGQEAIERLAQMREQYKHEPLFIVCDLNMPVMDGWEFIDHLRQEYRAAGRKQGIPIIVLSSTSGEKGQLLFKKTVHHGKNKYKPLVSVAKEVCMEADKYDAKGEKGLGAWMKHFMRYG